MSDLTITVHDLFEKDALSTKRAKLEKLVDNLLKFKPGPERWQEALKLYVALNLSATDGMTAAEEVYYTVQENKRERQNMKNSFGKSEDKNSDLRYQMHWPAGFKTLLGLVDPRTSDKRMIPELRKAFPQFVISEKY
jgi:hypothetical protein